MKKCTKTKSGKHLMRDNILSHTTFHRMSFTYNIVETYMVEHYFLKCSACGYIDDSKSLTQAEISNL